MSKQIPLSELKRLREEWNMSLLKSETDVDVIDTAIELATEREKIEVEGAKTVVFTPFEVKMMEMSLHHQWFGMTDDNGDAVNCEQKSADCVLELLKRFEKLRAEVEKENSHEVKERK